jgi:hypothetical protein
MSHFVKKKSRTLSKSYNIEESKPLLPVSPLTSESPFIQSTSINDTKIQTDDIQTVGQKWDGTQWHSLCQYCNGDCIRYSAEIKHEIRCNEHFQIQQRKEYEEYRLHH